MAKQVKIVEQGKAPQGIIINQITVNRVNRQILDIGKWRQALSSADMDRMTLLYDLYEDILLDGRLWDAIDRRIRAVTGSDLTFQFQDGSESQELIDLIDTEEFEYLLSEIMQSLFWGVSLLQLDFADGMNTFSIPRKHIRPKSKTVAVLQNDIDGQISYADIQNVVEVVNKRDKFGLILRAAPYVIMMRGGLSDWAQMVELFGMPQRVGKYSIYDQEARKQLEQAFKEQGAAASMVVPKETDVETATSAGSVNSSIYKDFMAELKEAMLVTVLSNTMTTLDGSSRSQSEVHQDTEDDVNKSDLRFVQRILNKHLKPILEARGFKVNGGSFVFPKALKDLTVDELVTLSDILEIPAYYFHDKFGLPQATGEDKLARKALPTPQEPIPSPPGEGTGGEVEKAKEPPTPKGEKDKKLKLSDTEPAGFWKEFFGFFADARTIGSRALSALNLADKSTSYTANISIDKLFEQAIKDIYAQYRINTDAPSPRERAGGEVVNKRLFDISNKSLQQGIDKTFSVEFGKSDPEFINQFKTNAAIFAAFKTHAQGNEIAGQLLDENGELRSFDKFRKAVLGTSIKTDYNINWLKTEYNMAVRSARMAEKWKGFEKVKHLYPNIEFMESTAANKRQEHLQWVGTILPIQHPWWNTHTPPVGWGCECSIENTDKDITTAPGYEEPVTPVFANNPGKTAEFINLEEHPMVKGVCPYFKSCKRRVNGFSILKLADNEDTPIIPQCGLCKMAFESQKIVKSKRRKLKDKEIREWAINNVPEYGQSVELNNFVSNAVFINRKSVDNIAGHFTELHLKELSKDIYKIAKKAQFINEVPIDPNSHNYDKKKARGVTSYRYYKLVHKGYNLRLNVEVRGNEEFIYSLNIIMK